MSLVIMPFWEMFVISHLLIYINYTLCINQLPVMANIRFILLLLYSCWCFLIWLSRFNTRSYQLQILKVYQFKLFENSFQLWSYKDSITTVCDSFYIYADNTLRYALITPTNSKDNIFCISVLWNTKIISADCVYIT